MLPKDSIPTMQGCCSFLDLPNELLLHVITIDDVVSTIDLYNLSFVCQRLRVVALPLFLQKKGIHNPEQKTTLYVVDWSPKAFIENADNLNALIMLPGLTSIHNFKCCFQNDSEAGREGSQEQYDLAHAVNRVSRLVQKLEHVEHAQIGLLWRFDLLSWQDSPPDVPMFEIQKWSDALGGFLNLLLERGCKTLRIAYDPPFEALFSFNSPGGNVVKAYLPSSMKNSGNAPAIASDAEGGGGMPFQFLQWAYKKPSSYPVFNAPKWQGKVDPPLMPAIPYSMRSLTILHIHSPVLLLPPFINWTLTMLRDFPHLSHICFANIAFIHSFAEMWREKGIWSTILPVIAEVTASKLTELSIRNCQNLEPLDLLQFLGSLHNLKVLTLYEGILGYPPWPQDFPNRSTRLKWSSSKPLSPFLPKLEKLIASEKVSSYILSIRSRSSALVKGKIAMKEPVVIHI